MEHRWMSGSASYRSCERRKIEGISFGNFELSMCMLCPMLELKVWLRAHRSILEVWLRGAIYSWPWSLCLVSGKNLGFEFWVENTNVGGHSEFVVGILFLGIVFLGVLELILNIPMVYRPFFSRIRGQKQCIYGFWVIGGLHSIHFLP